MTTYLRIYYCLKDFSWHNKSEFCRAYSDDTKRLREMRHEKGWIDYEEREVRRDGKVYYTEYRLKEIKDSFWEYARKFGILKQETSGQLSFV